MNENIKSIDGLSYLDGAPVSIEISEGIIAGIRKRDSIPEKPEAERVYIAPGFIDNQVNGYCGVSFNFPELSVDAVRKVTQSLWQAGVTTYLPTLTTDSHKRLKENLAILKEAASEPELSLSIAGFHLEGPFISPEDGCYGIHNRGFIRPPDWEEFIELNEAAGGRILQVSLAPERNGGIEFIQNCVTHNIVAGLVHHNASPEILRHAIKEGSSIAVHLGNGCKKIMHRNENPFWVQLSDDRIMASIIADRFHLLPEQVKVFYRCKGNERLILTSDVTMFAGMPSGEYEVSGRKYLVTSEGMVKSLDKKVLAGSAMTLSRCIFNMMEITDCSLGDAINMGSRNPARLYKLNERGEIKKGKRADLILFTLTRDGLDVKATVVKGKVVYKKE